MVLTRELLVGSKRYLSVPAALVLSVVLQSAPARLSVPWSVHWVADAAAQGAGQGGKQLQWGGTTEGGAGLDGRHRPDAFVANLAG
jgi:hypothetical protein